MNMAMKIDKNLNGIVGLCKLIPNKINETDYTILDKNVLDKNRLPNGFVQEFQMGLKLGELISLYTIPYTKIVRAVTGRIINFGVDCRKSSSSHNCSYVIELSSDNLNQLLIPPGVAHGFLIISEKAEISFNLDGYLDSSQLQKIPCPIENFRIRIPGVSFANGKYYLNGETIINEVHFGK